MTLKKQVEKILQDYPNTRNSDITLMIELWKQYYPQRIREERIFLMDLYDLPREDNLKRIRALFNAKGKYWPTDLKIAVGRGIKEEQWREVLGYPRKTEIFYPTKAESYTDKVKCSCGSFMQPTESLNIYRCPGLNCNKIKQLV